MNKQILMNLASKFLPQEKINKLSNAFDSASSIMEMASNPQEALAKAGITQKDLTQIEAMLNNPMASMLLKPLGVDKNEAQRVIAQLKGQPLTEQVPVDELDNLQKALQNVR